MTLTDTPVPLPAGGKPVLAAAADPFGLWQVPPASVGGDLPPTAVSFSLPAEGEAPPAPSAVWTLALTSGPDGKQANTRALERLAEQVQSIEAGLAAAIPRSDAFLSARAQVIPTGPGAESFTTPFEPSHAPDVLSGAHAPDVLSGAHAPEAGLAAALAVLEPTTAESAVSYGLPANIDWEALYQRLTALFDSVNRQILHFAWVDTTLDGRLVARSTVNWGGDFVSTWLPGLSQEIISAHCRSLELAMASRLAYLRAILTASQIAGKIALALTTPLGPLQALALAWQFINSMISDEGLGISD